MALKWKKNVGWLKRWRRRQISKKPLSDEARSFLADQCRYDHCLAPRDRKQLHELIAIFLSEKRFISVHGAEPTERDRLTVAMQACLMILKLDQGCYDDLDDIIIYPEEFVVRKELVDEVGVVTPTEEILQGESWAKGHIVLSLADVRATLPFPHEGDNVILHEFAHQLDAADGNMNGAPRLSSKEAYRNWEEVMRKEYRDFRMDVRGRAPTLLAPYGATEPAEFFAVASEAFFQTPVELRQAHPSLYEQLTMFFRLDPAALIGDRAGAN